MPLLPFSFVHSCDLRHTQRHSYLNDLWHLLEISSPPTCAGNNEDPHTQTCTVKNTNASFLTQLRLHRATHGCKGRRSTPPQHDEAPLMMPSEHVARHKPAQHLWSPAGLWSSSGSTRTRDLRRQRAGSQMKTFLSSYLLLTSHIAQYSLVISVLYGGKRQMHLFTKDNHPTREG